MKKYVKYIPHVLFAYIMLWIGAKGKLMGADMAKELFTMLDLFGQPEHVGRLMVGFGELFAGIGIFIKPLRKIAAVMGIVVMLGAIFFHATMLGLDSSIPAFVGLALGIYILFSSRMCKKCNDKCTDGTCSA